MRRKRICLLAGMMVFLLMMILAVHFGNYPVRVREIGQVIGAHLRAAVYPDSNVDTIVWKIRLPRVLTAAMTGVLLSVSGAVFQGIFPQTPLVEPYVLGVSSGAAFGAAALHRIFLDLCFQRGGGFPVCHAGHGAGLWLCF